jgi:hypothetical protein
MFSRFRVSERGVGSGIWLETFRFDMCTMCYEFRYGSSRRSSCRGSCNSGITFSLRAQKGLVWELVEGNRRQGYHDLLHNGFQKGVDWLQFSSRVSALRISGLRFYRSFHLYIRGEHWISSDSNQNITFNPLLSATSCGPNYVPRTSEELCHLYVSSNN